MNTIRKVMMVLIISIPVILSISFADKDDLPVPICKCQVKPTVVAEVVSQMP